MRPHDRHPPAAAAAAWLLPSCRGGGPGETALAALAPSRWGPALPAKACSEDDAERNGETRRPGDVAALPGNPGIGLSGGTRSSRSLRAARMAARSEEPCDHAGVRCHFLRAMSAIHRHRAMGRSQKTTPIVVDLLRQRGYPTSVQIMAC
jgi:hypothetical protein